MQTAYSNTFPQGKEGAIADNRETEIISLAADEAIKPGRFVCAGATPGSTAALPASAGDVTGERLIEGVVALIPGREPNWRDGLTAGEYATTETLPVVRKGVVWMLCETDCTYGGEVFVRHTANGGADQLGKVRKDADVVAMANTADVVSHARFLGTLTGAGLVKVEIDLPAM